MHDNNCDPLYPASANDHTVYAETYMDIAASALESKAGVQSGSPKRNTVPGIKLDSITCIPSFCCYPPDQHTHYTPSFRSKPSPSFCVAASAKVPSLSLSCFFFFLLALASAQQEHSPIMTMTASSMTSKPPSRIQPTPNACQHLLSR